MHRVPARTAGDNESTGESVFSLTGIRHAYGGREVLRLDEWRAAQGEQWLLVGPSGAGKSTLLHILACLLRPQAGNVSLAGTDAATLSAAALDRFRGQHVGIVLQKLHLVASLTVRQNLLLAQYLAGVVQDDRRVKEVLDRVGIGDRIDSRPHELSQGQAQRVAIARAVINRPTLLLADEPTSSLDDARCNEAFDLIMQEAGACGATLVVATHDRRIGDRVQRRIDLGLTS